MHYASIDGHKNIVHYLISNGADVNVQNSNKRSPIHEAIAAGNANLVKYLIDHNANIELPDSECFTPLHQAVMENRLDIVKLLVHHNSNINCRSNLFYTPLSLSSTIESFKYFYSHCQANVYISPFAIPITPQDDIGEEYHSWFKYFQSLGLEPIIEQS